MKKEQNNFLIGLTLTELMILILFFVLIFAVNKFINYEKEQDNLKNSYEEKMDSLKNSYEKKLDDLNEINNIEGLKEDIKKLENNFNDLVKYVNQRKINNMEDLKEDITNLEENFDTLVENIQQVSNRDMEDLKEDITNLEENFDTLVEDIEQVNNIESLKEDIKKLENNFDDLVKDIESNKEENKDEYKDYNLDNLKERYEHYKRNKMNNRIDDMVDELISDNKDLKNQNRYLVSKLNSNSGGAFGKPPCWVNEYTNKIEYVFDITLNEDNIEVSPGYNEYREEYAQNLPNFNKLINKSLSLNEFVFLTKPIFEDSVEKECVYYVIIRDNTNTKFAFKEKLFTIERYFYKKIIDNLE